MTHNEELKGRIKYLESIKNGYRDKVRKLERENRILRKWINRLRRVMKNLIRERNNG
jgi:IS1 family transposase